MDTNKLTELTNQLNKYKNEIRIKKDELNSPYEYIKYSQPIDDLAFSIYGLNITLNYAEEIVSKLKIAEQTHSDCYFRVEEEIETDMWDEWSSGDCTNFVFYGDLQFSEEEIEIKKSVLMDDIEKYELKCKEIEKEIKELVIGG